MLPYCIKQGTVCRSRRNSLLSTLLCFLFINELWCFEINILTNACDVIAIDASGLDDVIVLKPSAATNNLCDTSVVPVHAHFNRRYALVYNKLLQYTRCTLKGHDWQLRF